MMWEGVILGLHTVLLLIMVVLTIENELVESQYVVLFFLRKQLICSLGVMYMIFVKLIHSTSTNLNEWISSN